MTKQFNIRSERAHELAVKYAQARGMPLSVIVEEAMEAFDRGQQAGEAERIARWRAAVKAIQEEVAKSTVEFEINDMYDEDGLPI